jgi:putative effector of murein hydrolase
MDAVGITDPVSRGLGIGASGQGLGVASIMHEKEAFPFAAVSMVLTAVAATTLVSIPPVANAIVNLACGN